MLEDLGTLNPKPYRSLIHPLKEPLRIPERRKIWVAPVSGGASLAPAPRKGAVPLDLSLVL